MARTRSTGIAMKTVLRGWKSVVFRFFQGRSTGIVLFSVLRAGTTKILAGAAKINRHFQMLSLLQENVAGAMSSSGRYAVGNGQPEYEWMYLNIVE